MIAHGNCETKISDAILTVTDICPGSSKGEMNPFMYGIALRVFPHSSNLMHADYGETNKDNDDNNSNLHTIEAIRILKIQVVRIRIISNRIMHRPLCYLLEEEEMG